MLESWKLFVRNFPLIKQFKIYKVSLAITSLIYIIVVFLVYVVIVNNQEIAKLLKYSENVKITELRKEKKDYESMNKQQLFKKFHLIQSAIEICLLYFQENNLLSLQNLNINFLPFFA